jgi:hypothetical protein
MVFATARHLCVKPINTCRVCCRFGAVETNPEASTDIYFGPTVPEGQQQRLTHDRAGARRMDHSSPLPPLQIGLRQDLSAE